MLCIAVTSSAGENSIKKITTVFTLLSHHLLFSVLTNSWILAKMGCFCDINGSSCRYYLRVFEEGQMWGPYLPRSQLTWEQAASLGG